jgi:hypothetical protein
MTNVLELRSIRGRAVLMTGRADHGVDPRALRVDPDLVDSLDEWASVAAALPNATEQTAELIARRGRQLAGRLANATGAAIAFTDPVSGERTVLAAPATRPAEPTPWGTGLTVSGFALVTVVFAMVVLSTTLGQISQWLAFAANAVVTLGLAPTIAITRTLPVWRWVAHGAVAGIAIGWLAWVIALLL